MSSGSKVILVDPDDRETGIMEKIEAHKKGVLHRAFSVFIFNREGRCLLHKRAAGKYHSAGLWTNACCSHPMPGETVEKAALRRLAEEMGITCPLTEIFSFVYMEVFENGLTEHEFDHVLAGVSDENPVPDPDEVADTGYFDVDFLAGDIENNPGNYTAWFRIAFPRVREHFKNRSF
jgi:isopentenyl-diphosphate Delta-isomerase